MRSIFVLIGLAALCAQALPAAAQAPLTLDAAIERALLSNPGLRA
jgi:hypothetical protein